MNEFEIIEKFFIAGEAGRGVRTGIGDDCAVLQPTANERLVVTTDTLVENVHFPPSSPPEKLGYRSCATALSDIAAMGGKALWASLALTLPKVEEPWMARFVSGFNRALAIDDTSLVGGDLTQGPFTITWHITGTAPNSGPLLRSGGLIGDDIYVSGNLGGAAYALEFLNSDDVKLALLEPYWYPHPRLELGRAIAPFATSCIDISDGFLGDLGHILRQSRVAAELDIGRLPVHSNLDKLSDNTATSIALNGGDDYELCFTAPSRSRVELDSLNKTVEPRITRVGKIVAADEEAYVPRSTEGELLQAISYRHFE